MEISFIPTPDVAVVLNALLDKFENRTKRSPVVGEAEGTYRASRSIKVVLDDLDLPSYFSQIDPQARVISNQQLRTLERQGLLQLKWLPGETDHLLHSIAFKGEQATDHTPHESLYKLLRGRR